MRIVSSKFRDYYDGVQAMGQDPNVVYVRKKVEIALYLKETKNEDRLPTYVGLPREMYGYWRYNVPQVTYPLMTYEAVYIGFCGKGYPSLHLSFKDGPDDKPREIPCYSIEEVDEAVRENLKEKQVEKFFLDPKGYFMEREWRKYANVPGRDRLHKYFVNHSTEAMGDSLLPYFERKLIPIFTLKHEVGTRGDAKVITLNDQLKQYGFAKIKDPYTAFQDIYMFLGGLARPDKTEPAISDELRAESKGFDKWSFRKEPTKKR